MNRQNIDANTRIEILSKIKKEILSNQKEREGLMIEFLSIKRKIASLDHKIGGLQRDMLQNIP